MPVSVKAHACKFRCGFVRAKRKTVENHEVQCFQNPDRRACQTCRHWFKGYRGEACTFDDPDEPPGCNHDDGPHLGEGAFGRADCPYWGSKEAQGGENG